MKNNKYIILTLFVIISIVLIAVYHGKSSYAVVDTLDENTIRMMLKDTAEAYYRKGNRYQYDQYRENKFLSPESINDTNYSYAVCSTFVYQVYYNTFGIRIPMLSKNHTNNAEANANNNDNVRYYTKDNIEDWNAETTQGKTAPEKTEDFVKSIASSNYLEVGDIVVMGFGSNGHTTMVYDFVKDNNGTPIDILMIHNNGEVYDALTHKEIEEVVVPDENYGGNYGSLRINRLADIINDLFVDTKNPQSYKNFNFTISFIKMITDEGKYLTFSNSIIGEAFLPNDNPNYKAGKVRYKYKSMDVEKNYSILKDDCSQIYSQNVNKDEYIEYSIKIKNNSDATYSGMKITENIDTSLVDYVSSSSTCSGSSSYADGKVIFKDFNIGSNKECTFTYKVKVKSNVQDKTEIVSTGTIDEYLPLKKIIVDVDTSLSAYQKQLIINLHNNNYSDIEIDANDNGKEFIKNVYKKIFNYEIDLSDSVLSYSQTENLTVNYTAVNDNYDEVIVGNLYGLELGSYKSSDCDIVESKNNINAWKAWHYWSTTTASNASEYSCSTSSTAYSYSSSSSYSSSITYAINLSPDSFDEYKNRARTLRSNMLETGDIIITETDNAAWLYVDGKLVKNGTVWYDQTWSTKTVDYYLKDLIGKNYAVLRFAKNDDFPRKQYKISYNANDSDENVTNLPNDTIYTYSTIDKCNTKISSQVPSRRGYTFSGWSNKINSAIYKPGINWSQSNANYSLYAEWNANNYTIKYNCTDGEKPLNTLADVNVAYDSNFAISNDMCTKNYAKQIGWVDSANNNWTNLNGTWTYVNGENGVSNNVLQLYPVWKDIILTVNDNSDIVVDNDNSIVKQIMSNSTVEDFRELITDSTNISFLDKDGNELQENSLIATGTKIRLTSDDITREYIAVVNGDVTGDGQVSLTDVAKLFQHYRKTNEMNSETDYPYIIAGDVKKNNEINLSDVAKLFQYIRGKISTLN